MYSAEGRKYQAKDGEKWKKKGGRQAKEEVLNVEFGKHRRTIMYTG